MVNLHYATCEIKVSRRQLKTLGVGNSTVHTGWGISFTRVKSNNFVAGIYIGWRCPEFKHDCQRVGSGSKCFCGHLLKQQTKFNGNGKISLIISIISIFEIYEQNSK